MFTKIGMRESQALVVRKGLHQSSSFTDHRVDRLPIPSNITKLNDQILNWHIFRNVLKTPLLAHLVSKNLDILRSITHPLSKATSKEDNGQLDASNTQGHRSNDGNIVNELGLEETVTSNLELLRISLSASLLLATDTAAVWGLLGSEHVGPCGGPVGAVLNTTAVQLLLHNVPSSGDPVEVRLLVVLHALVHVLHHLGVQITLQHVGSDSGTDLSDEDDSEEESVGVDQALALLPGATAAQEGHQEDHTTDDHQEDWSVHITLAQEVQEVLGCNLGPGTKSDEDTSSEDEEDVEEDHKVLHETLATVLHGEAFGLRLSCRSESSNKSL